MASTEISPVDPSGKKDNQRDPIRQILAFNMADGALTNPRCKLCNSPFRNDAEDMYDKGRPLVEIKEHLSSNGEDIALSNIQNHLKEHYKDMEQMAALLDYCDRLEELKQRRRTREQDLDMMIRVCYMELARAIALPTNNDISREKVRTELILKINSAVADNVKTLNSMEDQAEAIKAIETKFAQAWKTCIDSADGADQKKMYAHALREFKRIMESQE